MQIPLGVDKRKWVTEHLYLCGTCRFYRTGICNNLKNETYGNFVTDEDKCEAYSPERRVENRINKGAT